MPNLRRIIDGGCHAEIDARCSFVVVRHRFDVRPTQQSCQFRFSFRLRRCVDEFRFIRFEVGCQLRSGVRPPVQQTRVRRDIGDQTFRRYVSTFSSGGELPVSVSYMDEVYPIDANISYHFITD
ncbi:MAG TPA: hypothetical protein VGQ21_06945, partial [Thermoanaerobaculia bacterium]|nr:hypothetical protein [Thermoanaerobaculia bacterium]